MNFRPKLIVFDLDGTLAESKQHVSPEMGELLADMLQHIPVAIMSGAAFQQFESQFLPAFPDDSHFDRLYLFPTSGARCFVYQNSAWVPKYDHSFTTLETARVMQAIKEAVAEVGFVDDRERPKEWGELIENRGAQITFSALGQNAPLDAKRLWDPKGEKRKPLYEALVRRLPDFSIRINATTSIDITKKGINKAYGIRKLIEFTDIAVTEMLYVGDALDEGGNDSVVIETGIKTHEVFGPEETEALLKHLLSYA